MVDTSLELVSQSLGLHNFSLSASVVLQIFSILRFNGRQFWWVYFHFFFLFLSLF